MTIPSLPRRLGLPLAMQMIAILVCVLLAAQAVTLALTVLLPPRPTARWNMDEVAAALTGPSASDRLERTTMNGPPDVRGQGWLVSESSREALARRLGRAPKDIVLAFYTQLPVGGVAVPTEAHSPLVVEARGGGFSSLLVEQAQAQAIPGGPPAGGGPGPGGMPGGGFPGGRMPGGGFPGGGMPGGTRMPSQPGSSMPGSSLPRPGMPQGGAGGSASNQPGGGARNPAGPAQAQPSGTGGNPGQTAQSGTSPRGSSGGPAGLGGNDAGGNGPGGGRQGGMGGMGGMGGAAMGPGMNGSAPMPAPMPAPMQAMSAPIQIPAPRAAASETSAPAGRPAASVAVPQAPASASAPALPSATPQVAAADRATVADASATPQPIPFRRVRDSLFDMASPPFIEGDFVAAARQADGRWLAVAPRAEPFPNAWQQRVMLWFALSLAIVSPLAWLFVRRIVLPLRDFARAAEQLGRDPSATILPLSGPAEIGRAANAFNQMRNRLRAFVDDRTAMVGAISHDLRTPLTRLRFRIEDVPDEQREGLLKEVSEMEAMISQVIAFIRDASTPGPRERVDFAELIAGTVADAQLVGADVQIEHNVHIPVDVDPVGIRRLLGNLLENAVKYGESARVRVSLNGDEAVAEILDAGPGIPEDEFDRAFEPFYRSETARKSGSKGSGLGLAVCRSIARAHGGDVSFVHAKDGFVARVAVPAAFDPALRKAA